MDKNKPEQSKAYKASEQKLSNGQENEDKLAKSRGNNQHLLQKIIEIFKELLSKSNIESNPESLNDWDKLSEYKDVLELVNTITFQDIGINPEDLQSYFQTGSIGYANLMEKQSITIGIFCIPAGMHLDLHDHPGMVVTTKVVYGEILRKSMDLVNKKKQFDIPKRRVESDERSLIVLEAIFDSAEIFKEGSVFNLTPTKGNIHSFTAEKDTIIFDILTPFYDFQTRYCNYYKEFPLLTTIYNTNKNNFYSTLNEIPIQILFEKSSSLPEYQPKKGDIVILISLFDQPDINVKMISNIEVPRLLFNELPCKSFID